LSFSNVGIFIRGFFNYSLTLQLILFVVSEHCLVVCQSILNFLVRLVVHLTIWWYYLSDVYHLSDANHLSDVNLLFDFEPSVSFGPSVWPEPSVWCQPSVWSKASVWRFAYLIVLHFCFLVLSISCFCFFELSVPYTNFTKVLVIKLFFTLEVSVIIKTCWSLTVFALTIFLLLMMTKL